MDANTSPTATLDNGNDRNKKFKQKLSGLRLASKKHFMGSDKYHKRVVEIAEEVFQTPAQFAEYAIPYLLTSKDLHHVGYSERVLPLLEKWDLTSRPQTVIAIMDYVAKNSFLHTERFIEKYGAMATKYLPPEKREVVFHRLFDNSVLHSGKNEITTRPELYAKSAQEYVPQSKWPIAYKTYKQALLHSVARKNRHGQTNITITDIYSAAIALSKFAKDLPLSKRTKQAALADIIGLLETPEKFFPGKEMRTSSYEERHIHMKAFIIYEAKRDLDPSSLGPKDYESVVADYVNQRNNTDSIDKKVVLLESCAKDCLPAEARDNRLATDLIYTGATALTTTPNQYNITTVASVIQSKLRGLSLTDEHRLQFKNFVEKFTIDAAANGDIEDKDLYQAFNLAAQTLKPEQNLAWIEEMTEKPFLNPDPDKNEPMMPFLRFLQQQFKNVVGHDPSEKVVATTKVAAGYVAGGLVMIFHKSTLVNPPSEPSNVVLLHSKMMTLQDCETFHMETCSLPEVQRIHMSRLNEIEKSLAHQRQSAILS